LNEFIRRGIRGKRLITAAAGQVLHLKRKPIFSQRVVGRNGV
jgi:hypothetical protein